MREKVRATISNFGAINHWMGTYVGGENGQYGRARESNIFAPKIAIEIVDQVNAAFQIQNAVYGVFRHMWQQDESIESKFSLWIFTALENYWMIK